MIVNIRTIDPGSADREKKKKKKKRKKKEGYANCIGILT